MNVSFFLPGFHFNKMEITFPLLIPCCGFITENEKGKTEWFGAKSKYLQSIVKCRKFIQPNEQYKFVINFKIMQFICISEPIIVMLAFYHSPFRCFLCVHTIAITKHHIHVVDARFLCCFIGIIMILVGCYPFANNYLRRRLLDLICVQICNG